MNTIKYLRWKTVCPECNSKLHKNMQNEIYCVRCGLLVLDYFPNTSTAIDNAIKLGNRQWREKKKNKIKRNYKSSTPTKRL